MGLSALAAIAAYLGVGELLVDLDAVLDAPPGSCRKRVQEPLTEPHADVLREHFALIPAPYLKLAGHSGSRPLVLNRPSLVLRGPQMSHPAANFSPGSTRLTRLSHAGGLWHALLLLAMLLSGCTTQRAGTGAKPAAKSTVALGNISADALRAELSDFSSAAARAIASAADEIAVESTDIAIDRNTVLWKARVTPVIMRMAATHDPRQGLVNTWVYCARLHYYFLEGPGKTIFGPYQPVAVQTTDRVLSGAEGIASRLLSPEAFTETRDAVHKFARANAFTGMAVDQELRVVAEPPSSTGLFQSIVAMPLAPFTAVEGISDAVAAMNDLTMVAARMADIADTLPEEARWQGDLLLYDIQKIEPVMQALADFHKAADSMTAGIDLAKQLPADFEQRAEAVLDEMDKRQAGVQKTLLDVRAASDNLGTMLQEWRPIAFSLENASSSLTAAGNAWQGVVKTAGETFGPLIAATPQGAPSVPGRPFNINDYSDAAQHLQDAASQATTLLAQARLAMESTAVAANLADVKSTSDAITDHAFLRAIEFVLLVFAIAFVYRVTITLIVRRREPNH